MSKRMVLKMKYIYILMMLLSITANTFAESSKLTVFYYDRLPYYGNVNGKVDGVFVDIAKVIFDEAGIRYEFLDVPSIRVLETLKAPGNTCALGWFKTKEREAVYTYSDDFIYQDKPYSIVVNKEKEKFLSAKPKIKEILGSGLVLGLIERYVYGDWLDGNILKFAPKTYEINIGGDSNLMYKLIIRKRFDYMFAGMDESSYVLKSNPEYSEKLSVISIEDAPNGNTRYILFSKGIDETMLKKINAAIKKVKVSDKYKQIISNIKSGN